MGELLKEMNLKGKFEGNQYTGKLQDETYLDDLGISKTQELGCIMKPSNIAKLDNLPVV